MLIGYTPRELSRALIRQMIDRKTMPAGLIVRSVYTYMYSTCSVRTAMQCKLSYYQNCTCSVSKLCRFRGRFQGNSRQNSDFYLQTMILEYKWHSIMY